MDNISEKEESVMTTSEKVAYLKGLAEGMEIGAESKEGKILGRILDILEDLALDIEDLGEDMLELSEQLDQVSEDVGCLEDAVYDEDEDEDDDGCWCCAGDCDDDEDGEPLFFEVTCPACDKTITIDEDVLELGEIDCPNCGERLEFDLSDLANAVVVTLEAAGNPDEYYISWEISGWLPLW